MIDTLILKEQALLKAKAEKIDQMKIEQNERIIELEKSLNDELKRITEEHNKKVKELISERVLLEKEVSLLQDKKEKMLEPVYTMRRTTEARLNDAKTLLKEAKLKGQQADKRLSLVSKKANLMREIKDEVESKLEQIKIREINVVDGEKALLEARNLLKDERKKFEAEKREHAEYIKNETKKLADKLVEADATIAAYKKAKEKLDKKVSNKK